MAENENNLSDYNESVALDRATMIREAAKKKASISSTEVSAIAGKSGKKVLSQYLVLANNGIWGLAAGIIPLLGLTLLLSLLLIFALFIKSLIASRLKEKGVDVSLSLWSIIYTWFTFLAQLAITGGIIAIIYMLIDGIFGILS